MADGAVLVHQVVLAVAEERAELLRRVEVVVLAHLRPATWLVMGRMEAQDQLRRSLDLRRTTPVVAAADLASPLTVERAATAETCGPSVVAWAVAAKARGIRVRRNVRTTHHQEMRILEAVVVRELPVTHRATPMGVVLTGVAPT